MSTLAPLLRGPLAIWRVVVPAPDVVYVKGIFEASEGVGAVLAPPRERHAPRAGGGQLVIAAPRSLAGEVARILSDLRAELGERMSAEPEPSGYTTAAAALPTGTERLRQRQSVDEPDDGCVTKSDPLA